MQQQTFKKTQVDIFQGKYPVPRKAKVFDCALVFPMPVVQV